MTKDEFIEEVALYLQKYAPQYNVCCISAPLSQFCLESAYGTSELAKFARNFCGLKYNKDVSGGGKYLKVGSEQNPDGSYVSSVMEWCTFENLEAGVKGYFDFLFGRTGVTRYDNLKGVIDPKQYLNNVRLDGYATSLKYVDNCYRVIEENDLTRFDSAVPTPTPTPTPEPTPSGYSNSSLVTYEKVCTTKNKTVMNDKKINYIIPHVYVGQVTAKQGADKFYTRTDASCQYVVGCNGGIALSVDEKDRAWTTGGDKTVKNSYGKFTGRDMDFQSVTMEIASDAYAPYAITDEAFASVVNLMADIAKRNNMGELKWKADVNLVGNPAEQNVLVHRWFASKSCPGDYVYSRLPEIVYLANEVNRTGIPYKPSSTKPSVALPTLKNGSTGAEALKLQKDLNYLGYTDNSNKKLTEDGILGNCSIQALIKFQKACNLDTDGIYGNASYNAMLVKLV